MTQPQTGLSTIGQLAVPVKDLPRAIGFYKDVLGIKFLFQAPPALAFFDCDGVRLLLDVPEDEEFRHPSSTIYFRVSDIQRSYAELKRKGVRFRKEPHIIAKMPPITLWMAFFWDTEGNTHAIMSEVKDV
ncbi:MAG: glyoxalase [Dehalococcoidia bacterium]|nr:glyoxalase [Dehalococcoidia bacterium]